MDEDMQVLREVEVAWLSDQLSSSIANLGYPVGMGIAPHPDSMKKAAETLFERYAKMIEMARATAISAAQSETWEALNARQRIVIEWGERCFGPDHMQDKIVRAARFFEEAAELVQAVGLPRDHAQRAFDHVYSREAGDPKQEAGGVANTLMALCGALGLSFDECQQFEIDRCLAKDPSHFAKRNEAKLREVDAAVAQGSISDQGASDGYRVAWLEMIEHCNLIKSDRFRLEQTVRESIDALERNSTSAPVVECLKAALAGTGVVVERTLDPATVEACAKHIEHEADLATNSLHCGDNSGTIAATHRVSRAYYEAAKSIRALAVVKGDRRD